METSTVHLRTNFLNELLPPLSTQNESDKRYHLSSQTSLEHHPSRDYSRSSHEEVNMIITSQQPQAPLSMLKLTSPVIGRKAQRQIGSDSGHAEEENGDANSSSRDDSIESMQRRLDRLQLSLNSSAMQEHSIRDNNDDEIEQIGDKSYERTDSHDLSYDELQAQHFQHHHHHPNHVDPNGHYFYKSPIEDDSKVSESIVHFAASENQLVLMRKLLDEDVTNLELPDSEGNTPFIRAGIAGHEEMVKFLIEQNTNVNAQNLFDNTILHEAAWRGYSRIIRLLCHNEKMKLNLKNKQGHTALHLSAQKGHNQCCRIILLSGCKPNKKNNFGDTALHSAARYGHIGVVRILISAFANVNELNKNDDTALHIASAMGRKKLTKVLLESGCNPTIINKQGETPMNIALRKAYLEIQELIANPPTLKPIYLKQREIYVQPFQSSYKDIYSALPKTPELDDEVRGRDYDRHRSSTRHKTDYPLRCKSDFSNCYLNLQTNQSTSEKQGTSISKYYSSVLSRQASPLDASNKHRSSLHQPPAHHSGHNHHQHHRHRHSHVLYSDFPEPKLETLPSEPLEKGEQYYVDLSGHIHKGKIKEEKKKSNTSATLTFKKR